MDLPHKPKGKNYDENERDCKMSSSEYFNKPFRS